MNKTIKILTISLMSAFLCMGMAACATCKKSQSTSTPGSSKEESVHEITLFNENLDIALYDSKQINYTCDTAVTFTSLDATILSVDDNGVVTALKVGTANVEVANEYDSATITYRVIDTGDVPYLELNIEESAVNLAIDDTLDLTATLLFKKKQMESNIVFSSSNVCVSITEGGRLTAVSEGTATITAKTTFFSQEVVAQITVNVVDNSVFLYGVDDTYTLCTWSENEPETVLLPTQVDDNGTIKDANFTYSYDEELLTNTGNAFSLKNKTYEGLIPVTMHYTNDNGQVYDFIVNIQSEYKRVDLTDSETVYRVGSAKNVAGYVPKFTYRVNGEAPVKILMGTLNLDYDPEKNTYNLDKISNGAVQWEIVTVSGIAYKININVSDFVLSTPEDVHAVLPIATTQTIYLGNDIDMSGSKAYTVDSSLQTNKTGFSGTLDGQGYTIKNLVMDGSANNGGLFFTFLGTVKNIAFINVDVTTSSSSYTNSVIGYHAGGTLENVYIDAFATKYGYVSGLFTYLRPNMEMVLRNVVVKFDNRVAQTDRASAIAHSWNTIANEDYSFFTIENVYALSNAGLIEHSDYNKDAPAEKIDRITKLTSLELIEKVKNDEITSDQLELFLRANFDCVSEDLTATTNYYVEVAKYTDGSDITGHATTFDEKINNTTGNIVSIKDGAIVVKADENAELDINGITIGSRVWTVAYDTGESYLVTVNLVNAILKTPADVLNVLPKVTGEYLLLGADIDMNGATAYQVDADIHQRRIPFSGTLDGQGYTISNLTMNSGLFEQLTGTVKNLAIVNATLSKLQSATLAYNGAGTVEDVFISVKGTATQTAGLFVYLRKDIPLVMKNVVVAFESADLTLSTSALAWNWNDTASENDACFTWNNIYVLSNVGFIENSDNNKGTETSIQKIVRVTESELIQKVRNHEIASEQLENFIRENYECDSVDLTATTDYYVEVAKYTDGSAITGHATTFDEKINNTTGNIVSIKDGATVIKADENATLDVSGISTGVRVWTVAYDTGEIYLVTVNLVDVVLKTPDDVLTVLVKATKEYIVLGKDIDMTGAGNYTGGQRFSGTLDGRGYAISNLNLNKSLFANTEYAAVVKNIALVNVSIKKSQTAVIAVNGQGTFENVFIDANSKSAQTAGMFMYLYGGGGMGKFTMKNVVVMFENPNYTTDAVNDSAAVAWCWNGNAIDDTYGSGYAMNWTNVFVVSNCGMMDGEAGKGTSADQTLASDKNTSSTVRDCKLTRVESESALNAKANDETVKGSVLAAFIAKYTSA